MNKNYIADVCKLLGVKVGEVFNINGCSQEFRINDSGFVSQRNNKNENWGMSGWLALRDLIVGNYIIAEKPFKPYSGERYWFVKINGIVNSTYFDASAIHDVANYKLGNCFRTKEEITLDIIDKYVAFFKSDEQMEIQILGINRCTMHQI